MDSSNIFSFFVYGTLRRGQCRETLWPRPPVAILPGWTYGALYDRADYPAMRSGEDRVLGECWQFSATDIPETIRALDAIEGTNQKGQANLYDRVQVEVFRLPPQWSSSAKQLIDWHSSDRIATAFGYHYSIDPIEDGFVRMRSIDDQPIAWGPLS